MNTSAERSGSPLGRASRIRKRRRLTQRRDEGSVAAGGAATRFGGTTTTTTGCGPATTLQARPTVAVLPARSRAVTVRVRAPGAPVSSGAPARVDPSQPTTPEPPSEQL